MKRIDVSVNVKQQATYPIFIGIDLLKNLTEICNLSSYAKIVILTDTIIEQIVVKPLLTTLPSNTTVVTIQPGEKAKTLTTVTHIWNALFQAGADRKSVVINVGGGVITDIGGFAASTYMRGIDFINIPTTVLAQVDASVGGKTGINYGDIKNSIGTFNQPQAVCIDVTTLATLPKRELLSGFAEIIKHGIIADAVYFQTVTAKKPEAYTQEEMIDIITQSCQIKSTIISNDPTEKGDRKLVNFGHTIGHALEALSLQTTTPLLHGEGVSLGMVAESNIAVKKGLLMEQDYVRICDALDNAGLPTTITAIDIDGVLNKIQHDKKVENGIIQWTLVSKIGKGAINQTVTTELIRAALKEMLI